MRNGESPTSQDLTHFHQPSQLRNSRLISIILLLRLASFSFSLASAVFMLTNFQGSGSPHWYYFDAFRFDFSFHPLPNFKKRIKRKFCNLDQNPVLVNRFMFVANAIVALYSVFEMGSCVWEFFKRNNVMA
ncbi:hypothetical protein Bca52824_048196 [Brassica carinata]|uniref:CASP-like protein n=1 Tax=Brassica carinata TaxID=52824 RepID=A0A8X7RIH9_BRACI|nr:hypothetical protein Bca52824_048196 [Brassica carinata]